MLFGFDIGNSRTVIACYSQESSSPILIDSYKTDPSDSPDVIYNHIKKFIKKSHQTTTDDTSVVSIVSSVVPDLNRVYIEALQTSGIPCHVISPESNLTIELKYNITAQIGADRIVNAQAAFTEYGGPCIIADCGTALTICVLLKDGIFDGGMIIPGMRTAARSLHIETAILPEIDLLAPKELIGKDTVTAIQSGIMYGWASIIEGLAARIKKNYGIQFPLVLTGGDAELIQEIVHYENSVFDPLLTLKGLKIIHTLNP